MIRAFILGQGYGKRIAGHVLNLTDSLLHICSDVATFVVLAGVIDDVRLDPAANYDEGQKKQRRESVESRRRSPTASQHDVMELHTFTQNVLQKQKEPKAELDSPHTGSVFVLSNG